jgi:hypothetical protein
VWRRRSCSLRTTLSFFEPTIAHSATVAILGSWAIAEIVLVWLVATLALPFGVGYVLGHGGFAAAAFAALGISTVLLSLQAGEGQVMQGMAASFLISAAPAYLGGRARMARRPQLR